MQQEDFAAAKIEGQTSIDSVDPFIASVTAWASTAVLAELVKLRSDLTETIVTADITEAQNIRDGAAKITAAIDAIPTLEEHQDEVYIAAEASAGNPRTDKTYAIFSAREYCTALLRDHPDVNSFSDKFAGVEMITDYRRVAAYCPAYLPAMDKVGTQIPGDGGYSVAATGTGYGSDPRVLAAETYGTLGTPSNCYWEVNDSHGNILRNNFIMAAPGGVTIRVAAGQGFTTQGCGWWERR